MNRNALKTAMILSPVYSRRGASARSLRNNKKMLMINRVEFAMLDHVAEVRKFQHRYALRAENFANACDKSVQVGDVRQYVVGMQNVGAAAVGAESLRQRETEELGEGRNPLLFYGNTRDVLRFGSIPRTGTPLSL